MNSRLKSFLWRKSKSSKRNDALEEKYIIPVIPADEFPNTNPNGRPPTPSGLSESLRAKSKKQQRKPQIAPVIPAIDHGNPNDRPRTPVELIRPKRKQHLQPQPTYSPPFPGATHASSSLNKKESNNNPLSGASIFIVADGISTDCAREEIRNLRPYIKGLGGKCVVTLDGATHALWVSTEARPELVSFETRDTLGLCNFLDIPVVDTSWLERVAGLGSHEHWSEIHVGSHVPAIVALVENHGVSDASAEPKSGPNEKIKSATVRRKARDAASNLGESISETYASLASENPEVMEEDSVRRAIELSLMDWALVRRTKKSSNMKSPLDGTIGKPEEKSPHEVLGVDETATMTDIKAAYRRCAMQTHPDKGGSASSFDVVAQAYRSLLHKSQMNIDVEYQEPSPSLKNTAHWDSELQEHQDLIAELFRSHGADVVSNLKKQNAALEALHLHVVEAGASNVNEKNERIRNSCFYLSLAKSYLHGIEALTCVGDDDGEEEEALREADNSLIGQTALQLKRIIEAAVVSAHPEWAAQGKVGEEVQAFSDFLVYILDSPTLLSFWAVAVFDTISGFVDVYKGKHYPHDDKDDARSNTLTFRYVQGHYQPLIPKSDRPSLEELLATFDKMGIIYVVTDGAA